jgi:hypothetical protein
MVDRGEREKNNQEFKRRNKTVPTKACSCVQGIPLLSSRHIEAVGDVNDGPIKRDERRRRGRG